MLSVFVVVYPKYKLAIPIERNKIVNGMLMGRGRVGVRKRQNCTINTGKRIHVVICIPL